MAMTAAVKDELSRVDVPKPCCRRAEMAALLRRGETTSRELTAP